MLAASMEDKGGRLTHISSSTQPFQITTRPGFTSETVLENKALSMASKDCSSALSSPAEASPAKPATASAAKSEGIGDAGQATSNMPSASDSLPCTVTDPGSDAPSSSSIVFGNQGLTDDFPPVLTHEGVSVSLENNSVWRQFSGCGTEMILTKQGRRMFPYCRYRLSGLDPEQQYKLVLSIDLSNAYKYRWNSTRWEASGKAEHQAQGVARAFPHHHSPSRGSTWMGSLVSFYKLKLTNNIQHQEGHVTLHSMHRYIPRLHVIPVTNGGVPTPDQPVIIGPDIMTFTFPQTEFMAVTTYQNFRITQLKINHNPFAKGFREVGLNFRLNRVRAASPPVVKKDINPTELKPVEPKEEKSEVEDLRTEEHTNSASLSSEQDTTLELKPVMSTPAVPDNSQAQPVGGTGAPGELALVEECPPVEPNDKNGTVTVIPKQQVSASLTPPVSTPASSARYRRRRKKKNRRWGNSQGRQWKAMAASPTLVHSPSLTVAMQPQLDDVEGLLFVSFTSKEALDVHVRDKPSSGPSSGTTPMELSQRDEGLPFISRTGKTNDVTKIKGWKNKFVKSNNASPSKCDEGSIKDQSAFCSNMLDEYLESEGQQIAERAAAFSTEPEGPVAYWLPTKSSSYVKTLDSALKHRSVALKFPVEGNISCPLSDKSLQCLAQASSVPPVGRPEVQSHMQPRAKLPAVSQRSPTCHSQFDKRRTMNSMPSHGNALRPQISYKVHLKLRDIEMETVNQGLNKTYLTPERLSSSLFAVLTATMMPHQFRKAPKSPTHTSAGPACGQQYCRLGCVCSSIGHVKREVDHCQHPDCMFDCVCLKALANVDQEAQPDPGSSYKKLWNRTTDEVDPEPLHIPQCAVFAAPAKSQTCTSAARKIKVIREEDKGPVYKYLESMMTCARVRAFNSKPPSEVTLDMKNIRTSTPNAATRPQKAAGNLPKTYCRTLLAVKKSGNISSETTSNEARVKKQIEIQSGCKWNQDREMVLESLYQRMNEGRLSQRFCVGPYHIRPVTRIFMRKPSGSILTYRVHISKPEKASDNEIECESEEENDAGKSCDSAAEDADSAEEAVLKFGVIPFLSGVIPAGTLRAIKKPVGSIGTGLIQVNGKSYTQAKLLLGNMGSLHPANRLAAYVTGRISTTSSISRKTPDTKHCTDTLESLRLKTAGTVIPPSITASATPDLKAPKLSPVHLQSLKKESSTFPQHLHNPSPITSSQHNSVSHRPNGSMPSPVSLTVSPSLKTPSFLGQRGTYSFRICPPANQGNAGGGHNLPGVALPGGFTLIQLPKPAADGSACEKTENDNDTGKAPLQIAGWFSRGYSVGSADSQRGATDHALRAAKNQSNGKSVDGGSSPELDCEEKMPTDEKNENNKRPLKRQADSNVDVVSEDLTSDCSDYYGEEDEDQSEQMVDIETVEEESQQMIIAKLKQAASREQPELQDSDEHCGLAKKLKKQVAKNTKNLTSHTMLERIRRSEQRDLFEKLQKLIPTDPKASRHYILSMAQQEIRRLIERSKQLEQEKRSLAQIQATYVKALSFFSGKSQNLIKHKVKEICERQKLKAIMQRSSLPFGFMPRYKTSFLENTISQSIPPPQPDPHRVSTQPSATQPIPPPQPDPHRVSTQPSATQPIPPPQPDPHRVSTQPNTTQPTPPPQPDPHRVSTQPSATQPIPPPQPDPHRVSTQPSATQPIPPPQPDPHRIPAQPSATQPTPPPQPDPHRVSTQPSATQPIPPPQPDPHRIPAQPSATQPTPPPQPDPHKVSTQPSATQPTPPPQPDPHRVPAQPNATQPIPPPQPDPHRVPAQPSATQPIPPPQPDPHRVSAQPSATQPTPPPQPDPHRVPAQPSATQPTPPPQPDPHRVSAQPSATQPTPPPQPDPHVVPNKISVFQALHAPQTDSHLVPIKIKVTGPLTPRQTASHMVPIKIKVSGPLPSPQTDSHMVPFKTKVCGPLPPPLKTSAHAAPTQTNGPQPISPSQPDPDIPTTQTTTNQTIAVSKPDLQMKPTPDSALQGTPPSQKGQAEDDSLASAVLGHHKAILKDSQEVPEAVAQDTMPCSSEIESQSQTPSDPAIPQAQDGSSPELSPDSLPPVKSNDPVVHLSKPLTLPLIRSKSGRLILPSSLKPSGRAYYAVMVMKGKQQGKESKASSSSDVDSSKNQEKSIPEAEQTLDPENGQNVEEPSASSPLVDQTAQSSDSKPKRSDVASPLVKLALLNQSISVSSGAQNPQDTSQDRGSMTPEKIQTIFEGFKSLEESKKTLTQMQSEYLKEASFMTGKSEKQIKPRLKELCDWQKQKERTTESDFYFSRLLQAKAALVKNTAGQSKAQPQSDQHKTSAQIAAQQAAPSLLEAALPSQKEHLRGDSPASVPDGQPQPVSMDVQEVTGDQAEVTVPDSQMENQDGAAPEASTEASPSTPLNTHTVSSPKPCTLPLIRSKTGRIILPSSLKPIGQGYYTLIVNKVHEIGEESEVRASPNPTPSDAETSQSQDKSVPESDQALDSESSRTVEETDASSPLVDKPATSSTSEAKSSVQTTPLAKLSFLNQSVLIPSVALQPLRSGAVAVLNKMVPTACLSFNRMDPAHVEPEPAVFRRRRGRPRKHATDRAEETRTDVIKSRSDVPVEESESEHETPALADESQSGLEEVTETRAEDSSAELSEVDDHPVPVTLRRGRSRRRKRGQVRSPTADQKDSSPVAHEEHRPSKSRRLSERYLQKLKNRDTNSRKGPADAVLLGNMNTSRPLTRAALGKDFPSAKKRSWVDVEKELDPELESE